MAETAASALIGVIFEKLTDEAFKKFARSQKIHSDLNELQSTLSRIKALLNDASRKETTDESIRLWLNSLQHLAYDIDDTLDDMSTEAMRHELTREAITSKVRKLIVPTCYTNLSLSHRLSPKIDSITTQLQQLEKQKGDLGLIEVVKQNNTNRGKETSMLESDVVGRKGEKKKLLKRLLRDGQSSKENFSIIPIVGMGGVGKTTLARLLYNDSQVKDHFKLRAWVCVSDDFDIFKISKTILQSISRKNKASKDLNQLQITLTEQLKDKRFLIVLDDVWTENYDDWEKLVRPFHSGALGSRVIMTTRKKRLLNMLGFDRLDLLRSLSFEAALSLLAQHALGEPNFDSHQTLRPKGEGIVRKCGCLPLALKAIGRLLRTKTGEDWEGVLNSEIWDSKTNIGDQYWKAVFPALSLSCHDLSADLKRLFAYCSLFPKDFLFNKEELVLLWMAEGLLDQSNAIKSPECFGEEHFNALLSRSFFQHVPNDESLFVMHDLMNDLATFVDGNYFLRSDNQIDRSEEELLKCHHMSFIREEHVGYEKLSASKGASLRTLIVEVDKTWHRFYLSNKILVDLIPQFPMLRVLSLRRSHIREVPDFASSLKHLRYLNLSETRIEELPENFGNLYNLQTLLLSRCRWMTKLPTSFLKLKKLRHFDISDTPQLKKLPLGIGELRSLHTLTKVIIGGDGRFAITKLKGLEKLQGEISIEGLHTVQNPMLAREALSQKRLTKLELKWDGGSDPRGTLEKEVLNELKPDSDSLKELAIVSYEGIEFPNWVGDSSYYKLVHVRIRGCRKCTSLPPLGQLPSLKELFVQGMDEVKVISTAIVFSSLEILEFEDMSGWEVWSADSEVSHEMFPRLRELRIKNCPKLIRVSLGALPLLRVLEIETCRDQVLRSLVHAASSITKLEITSISFLADEQWRDITQYLGAVEHVIISNCSEIRYLWESEAKAGKILVNLKELYVRNCDKLVSLCEKEEEDDTFGSSLLSSLRLLKVWGCRNLERCCCPNNIESLYIYGCSSVTVSFPTAAATGGGGGGQNLKSLRICNCKKLMAKVNNTSIPMQLSNSIHLTDLRIEDCTSIESFPDIQLPNLSNLTIESCENLNSFPEIQLPSLTSMKIDRCKNLKSFPDLQLMSLTLLNYFSELSHLLPSSLTKLWIHKFDKLESLSVGLQHLTSLQRLTIWSCPKMKHLPKTPLPSLLSLTIRECPKLRKRCEGRGSHHYPLISHIPDIDIYINIRRTQN